jgi:hypothetical protein
MSDLIERMVATMKENYYEMGNTVRGPAWHRMAESILALLAAQAPEEIRWAVHALELEYDTNIGSVGMRAERREALLGLIAADRQQVREEALRWAWADPPIATRQPMSDGGLRLGREAQDAYVERGVRALAAERTP